MIFSRIDLSKTNYNKMKDGAWGIIEYPDMSQLSDIYKKYCRHKNFKSVMPLFASDFGNPCHEIIGYMSNDQLVAFSIIKILDNANAECMQFAWDYANPGLRLGIKSLEHECAWFKERGYQYLYLGGADQYKANFNGFEILGPL